MSTRANIILRDLNGAITQYYHHTSGYPEYLGKMLASFLTASDFCEEYLNATFKGLLMAEGRFENEGSKIHLHGDIEYLWFVDLPKMKITYTPIPILAEEDMLASLGKAQEGTEEYFDLNN